ncbi:MAPEG family protein [Glycocaulis sp.]|uniref:MAPEG family protein n=1 Tax=Glycocaulis sp. TaxID=1969725 RepID=UPI0025BE4EF1|nr:MAPEG family protein [Glycocaulis sp.]MCH8520558.1 MAPEG family protein [Glycocaulis sp.]
MYASMMVPVLALVCWTLVMWTWMYATRIPAMQKAGLKPAKLKEKSELDVLPRGVRQIADNHNHLHEQPVLFYALAMYSHLVGVGDPVNIGFAWSYVILRIAHSLFQATVNFIPVRFLIYTLATLCLFVIVIRNVIALLA